VLERFFAAQLSAIVGDYVDGVTPESLDLRIGLRSGSAELHNLKIKQGVRAAARSVPLVHPLRRIASVQPGVLERACSCDGGVPDVAACVALCPPPPTTAPPRALHTRVPAQALDKLEIPFIVRVGVIEKITLTTPAYSSLLRMTGEPVVVTISGVYLLVDKSIQTPEEVRLLHPCHRLFSALPACR
jgi:hypothetical protein